MMPNNTPLAINPTTVSPRSPRGAQYVGRDENGNLVVYTSPTTASETLNQNRMAAHGEVDKLYDQFEKGTLPYAGIQGLLRHGEDYYDTSLGKLLGVSPQAQQEAQARITNYALAKSISPELAGAIDRYVNGKTTVQGREGILKSALTTHPFISQEAAQSAIKNYLPLQTAAYSASMQPSTQNYPIAVQGGTPAWVHPGFGGAARPTNWTDMQASVRARMAARKQGNSVSSAPQAAPKSAASSSLKIPTFKSKEEYLSWYDKQPPARQAKIKAMLR